MVKVASINHPTKVGVVSNVGANVCALTSARASELRRNDRDEKLGSLVRWLTPVIVRIDAAFNVTDRSLAGIVSIVTFLRKDGPRFMPNLA